MAEALPFSSLNNEEFDDVMSTYIRETDNHKICDQFNEDQDLGLGLHNPFEIDINESDDNDGTGLTTINCKYYSIDQFNQTKVLQNSAFDLFHLNSRSLNKNFSRISDHLSLLEHNFAAIAFP